MSAQDKSEFRLALEVRTFVGAGTETTGNTLSVTTFHLLANPDKAQRLKKEVQAAQKKSSTALKYQDLLQLPYLVSYHTLSFCESRPNVLDSLRPSSRGYGKPKNNSLI